MENCLLHSLILNVEAAVVIPYKSAYFSRRKIMKPHAGGFEREQTNITTLHASMLVLANLLAEYFCTQCGRKVARLSCV